MNMLSLQMLLSSINSGRRVMRFGTFSRVSRSVLSQPPLFDARLNLKSRDTGWSSHNAMTWRFAIPGYLSVEEMNSSFFCKRKNMDSEQTSNDSRPAWPANHSLPLPTSNLVALLIC